MLFLLRSLPDFISRGPISYSDHILRFQMEMICGYHSVYAEGQPVSDLAHGPMNKRREEDTVLHPCDRKQAWMLWLRANARLPAA